MVSRPQVSVSLADIAHELNLQCTSDALVTGITHDSRQVQPGDLYVAIPGLQQHGINFLAEALANGAVAIASDHEGCLQADKAGIPSVKLNAPRRDMALLASAVYDHPERKMALVGVTGTNGKTTVTQMLRHVLLKQGKRTGVIGTLGAFIDFEKIPTLRTTPESTDLYALLAQMHAEGVETVCMEVSSHALALDRVAGLFFDVAIFTNLTQDHLDFHGTMNAYFDAKSLLFRADITKTAIINVDDEWGRKLVERTDCSNVVTVGEHAQWSISHEQSGIAGITSFALKHDAVSVPVEVPMFGLFNATNAALCLTTLNWIGENLAQSAEALHSLPQVPGRMEVAWSAGQKLAIVDYAHTPDAVEKVLQQIRAVQPKQLITVLGCGGDRDPVKRPIMGKLAAQYSDVVIVTDDNPRSENPELIRQAIIDGIENTAVTVENIGDRRMAIKHALELCGAGDIVAVLGKGHESGQEIAGVITPFDDRNVVREEAQHV